MSLGRAKDLLGRFHNDGQILKEEQFGSSIQYVIDFGDEGIRRLSSTEVEVIEDPVDRLFKEGRSLKEMKVRLRACMLFNDNLRTNSLARQKIDVLPHQLLIAEKAVSSHHRGFLIADDVGLGKTIEAGLVIRSLMARGRANNVLIICPASLTLQWREQMLDRFDEWFNILSSEIRIRNERQWDQYTRMIASIQTLRMRENKKLLLERSEGWDLVVVDEAHHLSAREYGNKIDTTDNYLLLKHLRDKSRFFLFLTATPHQGDDDRFAQLLSLLEPDLVKSAADLPNLGYRINELMGRNLKKEVTDFQAKKLFKDHRVFPHEATGDKEYYEFLDSLKKFVEEGMESVSGKSRNARYGANLILTSFLKMAASSPYAIQTSLSKRYEALTSYASVGHADNHIYDERYEGEHEESEIARAKEIFIGEAERIKALLDLSRNVKDPKLAVLDEIINNEGIDSIAELKLLVFTEYRGTQEMLAEHLENKLGEGSVSILNGSQDIHEKRRVIKEFEKRTKVLISTEAGGEGLDLQRNCHIMVNYDVPWNPMRLHQRTGRLDRYGQSEMVRVHHIIVKRTIDEKIQRFLDEKIKRIQQTFGKLSGDNAQHLREEVLGRVSLTREEVTAGFIEDDSAAKGKIERRIEEAVQSYKRGKDIFGQIKAFDLKELGRLESKYSFKDLESLIHDYLPFVHRRLVRNEDGIVHFEVPDEIRAMRAIHGKRLNLKRVEGIFDRAVAKERDIELLGIGQPYIDAMIDHMIKTSYLCDAVGVRLRGHVGDGIYTKKGALAAYLVSTRSRDSAIESFDGVEFVLYDVERDEIIEDSRIDAVLQAVQMAEEGDVMSPSEIPENVRGITYGYLERAIISKPRDGKTGTFHLGALIWFTVS